MNLFRPIWICHAGGHPLSNHDQYNLTSLSLVCLRLIMRRVLERKNLKMNFYHFSFVKLYRVSIVTSYD